MTSQFIHMKMELAQQISHTHELLNQSDSALRAAAYRSERRSKALQAQLMEGDADRLLMHEKQKSLRMTVQNQAKTIELMEEALSASSE